MLGQNNFSSLLKQVLSAPWKISCFFFFQVFLQNKAFFSQFLLTLVSRQAHNFHSLLFLVALVNSLYQEIVGVVSIQHQVTFHLC